MAEEQRGSRGKSYGNHKSYGSGKPGDRGGKGFKPRGNGGKSYGHKSGGFHNDDHKGGYRKGNGGNFHRDRDFRRDGEGEGQERRFHNGPRKFNRDGERRDDHRDYRGGRGDNPRYQRDGERSGFHRDDRRDGNRKDFHRDGDRRNFHRDNDRRDFHRDGERRNYREMCIRDSDQNVWGRAIETGFLEDPWNGPTKDCYSYTDDPAFPPVEDEVVIEFKQGIPVKIDGHDVTPLQAIEEMNRRAGAQGIGRIDLIEDRLVGIKSRELYEAPGAIALITAHQELENCCLEREQHRIKRDIDKRWAELVYDAQWFSPATQSLNAFIEDTQKYVSGEIRMILHGGRAVVTGRRSDTSLYDYNLATYDSGDSFDQKSSNGFIDIYGLPSRVAAARDVKFGNGIEVPENSVE